MVFNNPRNFILPAAAYLLLTVSPASAQLEGLNALCIDHFGSNQQPRVPFETRTQSADGKTTFLSTAEQILPEGDSFGPNPPNVIETKYEDAESCRGNPIPNTLASTPSNPYNLHPDPIVSPIDKTSPTDDLDTIMDTLEAMLRKRDDDDGDHHAKKNNSKGKNDKRVNNRRVARLARGAIDIIEGNPLSGNLAGRVYEGFPLLHYLGGLKTKTVDPVTKTVTINQIWYDNHIESDTNYVDPAVVDDEQWTIVYNINMLNRSHDDFAPYAMFFDDPDELDLSDLGGPNLKGARIPNVGMDQTFFPMEEGLRYTLEMAMPPARFWNLTYHWGWRIHPPKVQVVENVNVLLRNGMVRNSAEVGVFGEDPRASEDAKLAAIDMIGDHAPAKRMWRMFHEIAQAADPRHGKHDKKRHRKHRGKKIEALLAAQMPNIRQAFYDWQNRNQLPTGFAADPDADMNLLFINNTMYGEVKGHDGAAEARIDHLWNEKGDKVRVNLLNGDYYVHAYVLVDFGGLRGFENLFHNTLPIGGAGPLFTFGRNYFWIHVAGQGPIPVPPAERSEEGYMSNSVEAMAPYFKKKGHKRKWKNASMWGDLMDPVANAHTAQGIGQHTVEVTFNYQPSRRLRMYQFDALHHDVSVWSLH
ncbi:MAG: hypothetical protein ACI915_002452 [Gammaproteobacteria bacterium]|jgi:hypothetical protein